MSGAPILRTRRGVSLLDAAIVTAALLTVGLLVLAVRLTSTTLDRNAAWNQAIGTIELGVALSYAWGEAPRARGAGSEARANALRAAAACRTLLGSVDGDPRSAMRRLCSEVERFRQLALARAARREDARAAYDSAFGSTLRRADEAEHALALEIAERRRMLNRLGAGLALLVLLVFAGMTAVVARRARQVAAHNERLRRLDRMKDTFIAAVSHELRTPLTSTLGALQTIERTDLDLGEEMRQQMVTMARVQAERLAQLVDELLFFSNVESGPLRLSPTTVDFAALVSDAAGNASPQAQAKGVTLGLVVEDVPSLRADRGRVAQLLAHLIENAIKFTPAGGSVTVRAAAEEGRAVVEIEDTGAGIPADEQQHLFERFFRSSEAVEKAIPGTGIGLSIVKAIVDAHNGDITIESEAHRGTKVRVELPLPAQESGSSAAP